MFPELWEEVGVLVGMRNCPVSLRHLDTCSPARGTSCKGLDGAVMLAEVCHGGRPQPCRHFQFTLLNELVVENVGSQPPALDPKSTACATPFPA